MPKPSVSVKEDVYDRQDAVELLTERLRDRYPDALKAHYKVEFEAQEDISSILEKIGSARGCIKAGGVIDIDKVHQLVLRDFRSGKMGKFTLDEI